MSYSIKDYDIKYIIKAYASKLANADYYAVNDDNKNEMLDFLIKTGWLHIECREIKKRDRQLESIIKRCALGSPAERANLRALFNYQE